MATFRGRPACKCLVEWLPVYESELKRRGVIKHSIDIYQLIGGAKASGGTHTGGGAYDLAQYSDEAIQVAREMGAAAWKRTKAQGFSPNHQHGVLNGCPHNTPARYQVTALTKGYNGLGRAGMGAADDGPSPRRLRTWREGIAWARKMQAAAQAAARYAPGRYRFEKSSIQTFRTLNSTEPMTERTRGPVVRTIRQVRTNKHGQIRGRVRPLIGRWYRLDGGRATRLTK